MAVRHDRVHRAWVLVELGRQLGFQCVSRVESCGDAVCPRPSKAGNQNVVLTATAQRAAKSRSASIPLDLAEVEKSSRPGAMHERHDAVHSAIGDKVGVGRLIKSSTQPTANDDEQYCNASDDCEIDTRRKHR